MKITPTTDWQLIRDIFEHDAIQDRVCNDWFSGKSEADRLARLVRMVNEPLNKWFLVIDGFEIVGCFLMEWKAVGVYEIHTMFLPSCRGKKAITAGKESIRFVFEMEDVEKLTSMCPMNHPEVYLFAKLCGFKDAGVSDEKWIKNGEEYNMKLVELNRNDLCL